MGTAILLTSTTEGEVRTGDLQGAAVNRTLQATVEGSGVLSATVLVEDSNDGIGWNTVATITLTGSDQATDRANYVSASEKWRVTVQDLAGTGAKVTTSVAYN